MPILTLAFDIDGVLSQPAADGDRSYVSQPLFEQLYAQGLELIARRRKNVKNSLVKLMDKILLRKRAIIESVNDQLKNICQIEHGY